MPLAGESRDEPSSCQDTETVTLGAALKAAAPNEEETQHQQHQQRQQQQQLRQQQEIETKPIY